VLFLNDILYKCIFFYFFNNCRQLRNDLNIIVYDMFQAFNIIRIFVAMVFLSISLCKFCHYAFFFLIPVHPTPLLFPHTTSIHANSQWQCHNYLEMEMSFPNYHPVGHEKHPSHTTSKRKHGAPCVDDFRVNMVFSVHVTGLTITNE
jgi:hypothetical protein